MLPTADPMLAYLRWRDYAPAYWQMGILWIMLLATAKETAGQFTLMSSSWHRGRRQSAAIRRLWRRISRHSVESAGLAALNQLEPSTRRFPSIKP
jgi:hypothetical protein